MKRTRRQENAIVVHFTLFIILFVIQVLTIAFYFYPKVIEIEKVKAETIKINNEINELNTKWLEFSDFKTQFASKVNGDIYLNNIKENLEKDFYDKHFTNSSTWNLSYSKFLEEKKSIYENLEWLKEKEELVQKILPIYSDKINDAYDWQLSDYAFINYVEIILESFNLTINDNIWISRKVSIEKFNSWASKNLLNSDIYYIPLDFTIEWSKKDILEFLIFIENVWNISINDSWNIVVNEPGDLLRNKFFLWQKSFNELYNNQIIDIETISFDKNFDSSFKNQQQNLDFISYLIQKQWNEILNINLKLLFYIRWVAPYKIKESIEETVENFTLLKQNVLKLVSRTDLTKDKRAILIEYNKAISVTEKNVMKLRAKIKDIKNLEKTFDESLKYKDFINETLDNIKNEVWISITL